MSRPDAQSFIRLRGVRHNNLKNFDLDLPMGRLIVITGPSGSGKSSLAFDTLFAEGQRRYIETFSPYARQFFDRMDKPQVDSIEGIPPAIAIEQRNAVRTTRSTVGTMTEICDHLKLLWPRLAQLHCRRCGRPVRKDPPQAVWETLNAGGQTRNAEVLITFTIPLSEKLSLGDSLALIAKQGYQRLWVDGEIMRLDEFQFRDPQSENRNGLTIVQDRLKLAPATRTRFVEACEQAYHFGKGKLTVHLLGGGLASTLPFSSGLHCAACDIEYREPVPALFSFNHPLGACPACRGFGRIISINYDLAIPDRSRTLGQGAVRPWQTGQGLECQQDLMKFCRLRAVPTNVPFGKLSPAHQQWVIEGDPGYGRDADHEWPNAWYGVKGYFRWLESKAYKMHVRVLLSRYRAYSTCPDCHGQRLQPEALLYRLNVGQASSLPRMTPAALETSDAEATAAPPPGTGRMPVLLSLADFYQLPIRDSLRVIEQLATRQPLRPNDPIRLVLEEVRSRLGYLAEVGLGYLTLDRATRTLSGGETERVNLTTCLGSRLVNTLFVLDEPSVGLHPRDTARLVRILERLREAGNTVVVVEHEAGVMRAADQIVDLGPGHGESGGQVVFQGPFAELLKCPHSLTGGYLGGRRHIEIPARRPVHAAKAPRGSPRGNEVISRPAPLALREAPAPFGDVRKARPVLRLTGANLHNLKNLAVEIPLQRFVCVTGVSGSGKTTLVREELLPALESRLKGEAPAARPAEDEDEDENESSSAGDPRMSTALAGHEHVGRVVLVDQSLLGRTPRSNPAVYVGAFDDLRHLFAESDGAGQRGLTASAFSFNSREGQCERCRGAGFEKIEMQFLSDVFIRCPDCQGRRYRPHVLEVKVESRGTRAEGQPPNPRSRRSKSSTLDPRPSTLKWSIADLLEATVDEAIDFLGGLKDLAHARNAVGSLTLLQEVGLGYLRLGQPINTLSGGESQRLKLVRHLAEAGVERRASSVESDGRTGSSLRSSTLDTRPTLFLFDEPTTGLHFDDVRMLLDVFHRLVDAGHSVLVIEHNLDVIRSADWIIDLGPDAGDEGGEIVAQGTPEDIAACPSSHTGAALREDAPFGRRAVRVA